MAADQPCINKNFKTDLNSSHIVVSCPMKSLCCWKNSCLRRRKMDEEIFQLMELRFIVIPVTFSAVLFISEYAI